MDSPLQTFLNVWGVLIKKHVLCATTTVRTRHGQARVCTTTAKHVLTDVVHNVRCAVCDAT